MDIKCFDSSFAFALFEFSTSFFSPKTPAQLEMDSFTKKQLLFSRSGFIYIELKGLENILDWAPEIPDAAPQFAYL